MRRWYTLNQNNGRYMINNYWFIGMQSALFWFVEKIHFIGLKQVEYRVNIAASWQLHCSQHHSLFPLSFFSR
jgi:hypothetical protein